MKKKNSERIRLIALSGMLAAMITIMTTFIRIPATHNGYTHAGDSMIYLAAMVLPAPYAATASSVGGFMADILAGAPEWAFATAIIKAINTLPFIAVRYYLKKIGRDNRIISPYTIAMLIPTSLVTIVGYYIADGLMFGFEASLVTTLITGWLQPTAGAAVFVLVGSALDGVGFKSKIYPSIMLTGRNEKEKIL
ncbi:MAG: TIGR04002 family protein [Acutalibacteraceae bacterium]|nr:TIGR04002 family protein [Acutalibacteraceae bacterium]